MQRYKENLAKLRARLDEDLKAARALTSPRPFSGDTGSTPAAEGQGHRGYAALDVPPSPSKLPRSALLQPDWQASFADPRADALAHAGASNESMVCSRDADSGFASTVSPSGSCLISPSSGSIHAPLWEHGGTATGGPALQMGVPAATEMGPEVQRTGTSMCPSVPLRGAAAPVQLTLAAGSARLPRPSSQGALVRRLPGNPTASAQSGPLRAPAPFATRTLAAPRIPSLGAGGRVARASGDLAAAGRCASPEPAAASRSYSLGAIPSMSRPCASVPSLHVHAVARGSSLTLPAAAPVGGHHSANVSGPSASRAFGTSYPVGRSLSGASPRDASPLHASYAVDTLRSGAVSREASPFAMQHDVLGVRSWTPRVLSPRPFACGATGSYTASNTFAGCAARGASNACPPGIPAIEPDSLRWSSMPRGASALSLPAPPRAPLGASEYADYFAKDVTLCPNCPGAPIRGGQVSPIAPFQFLGPSSASKPCSPRAGSNCGSRPGLNGGGASLPPAPGYSDGPSAFREPPSAAPPRDSRPRSPPRPSQGCGVAEAETFLVDYRGDLSAAFPSDVRSTAPPAGVPHPGSFLDLPLPPPPPPPPRGPHAADAERFPSGGHRRNEHGIPYPESFDSEPAWLRPPFGIQHQACGGRSRSPGGMWDR